jgi:hypothetical protein
VGAGRRDRHAQLHHAPSEIAGFRNPFHVVCIPNMGLTLGEIFNLEELAADCAADGRWEFLLVAPPPRHAQSRHADQPVCDEVRLSPR